MLGNLDALKSVCSAQESEVSRNRVDASLAADKGNEGLARLYRALARGRDIHVEKLRAALQSLGAELEAVPEHSVEERVAVMDELSSMVMTAASERQPLIESLLFQIMKADMSHQAVERQVETPADSYHVCLVCGYVAKDVAPERCPVCRAQAAQFEAVT